MLTSSPGRATLLFSSTYQKGLVSMITVYPNMYFLSPNKTGASYVGLKPAGSTKKIIQLSDNAVKSGSIARKPNMWYSQ